MSDLSNVVLAKAGVTLDPQGLQCWPHFPGKHYRVWNSQEETFSVASFLPFYDSSIITFIVSLDIMLTLSRFSWHLHSIDIFMAREAFTIWEKVEEDLSWPLARRLLPEPFYSVGSDLHLPSVKPLGHLLPVLFWAIWRRKEVQTPVPQMLLGFISCN